MSALLEVRGLTVDFAGPRAHRAVDGAELTVAPRERLAIVGESGSGKSQLLLACTGLLAANGRASGSVRFAGHELLGPDGAAAEARGAGIGFVFQDAGGSLTPHRRVGDLLVEVAMMGVGASKREARSAALALLERVRLPDPARTFARYSHELSGGMRQRAALALALMARPRLLFADEPTTALDVTLQAEVMALLAELCDGLDMALVLVTHDLGVAAALADRIAVMYAGRIVEEGSAAALLSHPSHPYTAGLLAAVPRLTDLQGSELVSIAGQPPLPGSIAAGCRFEPRCPRAGTLCRAVDPPLESLRGSRVACHFPTATET
ncbi:MAG TPA: ABC transporter ATP-binding protein, partial [Steroidobacteraceae bacterium]|nr:ABC transporter ATP-binding protein [Steroidobacteraceae bacterium]